MSALFERDDLVRLIVAQQWATFWALIEAHGLCYVDKYFFNLDDPDPEVRHLAAMAAWDCAILEGLKYKGLAKNIAKMPCAVDVVAESWPLSSK